MVEVKEESCPRPPAQLWHEEGAQQLWKAEPSPEPEVDHAIAVDHPEPPFLGKPNPENAYFLYARPTSTTTPGASPTVSSIFFPAAEHCSPSPVSVSWRRSTRAARSPLDPTATVAQYRFALDESLTEGPRLSAF